MLQKQEKNLKNGDTRPHRIFFTFGIGKDRDYFVENLSMLVAGGMPITSALDAIALEIRSVRMKKIIAFVKRDIEFGSSLWRALTDFKLFPEHAISLIRLGEESGKLIENLKVVAIEQEKSRIFKSKLRSAMMYPIFVLSLTLVIGIGIAWFILPKLATVFSQLKIKLPLITKALIAVGVFFSHYGAIAIPAVIVGIILFFFFLFSFSKTKFIGQFFLFFTPGVKELITEVEIARFGYLLGTLLKAGLPIMQALDSLASATEVFRYKKLYLFLRDSVEEGNSIQKSFSLYKRARHLIPTPIQQLIVVGERSGTLAETVSRIGQTFEGKADTTTKNLTVILEPILLVIVWVGVVTVALAVVLPIYSLIGGFNAGGTIDAPPPPVEKVVSITSTTQDARSMPVTSTTTDVDIVSSPGAVASTTLRILPTGIGYLNVRSGPSTTASITRKVLPGDVYEFREVSSGWYNIILDATTTGWVIAKYVEVIK